MTETSYTHSEPDTNPCTESCSHGHSSVPINNCIVIASTILIISTMFGFLPLLSKKFLHSKGLYYNLFCLIIIGINFGNICYDIIPEMNGSEFESRFPCAIIGITVIALLFVESLFEVKNTHHEHVHKQSNEQQTIKITKHLTDSYHNETIPQQTIQLSSDKDKESANVYDLSNANKDHHHDHLNFVNESKNLMQTVIFLIGISLHSFFEGLDTACHNIVDSHTIGLILHKIPESLSIGMALFSSKIKKSTATLLMLGFSLLTPSAIFIGRQCKKWLTNSELYFKALALGSLLYVVFLEGIPHELEGGHKKKKLLFLFIGYIISITIITMTHN